MAKRLGAPSLFQDSARRRVANRAPSRWIPAGSKYSRRSQAPRVADFRGRQSMCFIVHRVPTERQVDARTQTLVPCAEKGLLATGSGPVRHRRRRSKGPVRRQKCSHSPCLPRSHWIGRGAVDRSVPGLAPHLSWNGPLPPCMKDFDGWLGGFETEEERWATLGALTHDDGDRLLLRELW